tara:strand:- start:675 stop:1316 length:642 start_codon:yes stop_codon:yes gene_type:complete
VSKKIAYTAKITTNEPVDFKVKFMKSFKNWEIEEVLLEIGDIILGCGLCIERKTINDFDGSILGGRLDRQIYEMEKAFDLSVIAVVGKIAPSPYMKHTRGIAQRVPSKMARIALQHPKIRIIRVDNNKQLFYLIRKLYDQYGGEPITEMPQRSKGTVDNVSVSMMTSLPQVGVKRAEKILDKYSWSELSRMDKEELMDIMPKKAAKCFSDLFG